MRFGTREGRGQVRGYEDLLQHPDQVLDALEVRISGRRWASDMRDPDGSPQKFQPGLTTPQRVFRVFRTSVPASSQRNVELSLFSSGG